MATGRRARTKQGKAPSCESCFFRCNQLCALALEEPCATFRPDGPQGLQPPTQMRFAFRTDTRPRASWSFPTAEEQALLHA